MKFNVNDPKFSVGLKTLTLFGLPLIAILAIVWIPFFLSIGLASILLLSVISPKSRFVLRDYISDRSLSMLTLLTFLLSLFLRITENHLIADNIVSIIFAIILSFALKNPNSVLKEANDLFWIFFCNYVIPISLTILAALCMFFIPYCTCLFVACSFFIFKSKKQFISMLCASFISYFLISSYSYKNNSITEAIGIINNPHFYANNILGCNLISVFTLIGCIFAYLFSQGVRLDS